MSVPGPTGYRTALRDNQSLPPSLPVRLHKERNSTASRMVDEITVPLITSGATPAIKANTTGTSRLWRGMEQTPSLDVDAIVSNVHDT
jgi:hypothetical protein